MQNAKCKMQNAECKMQNAECKMQNAELVGSAPQHPQQAPKVRPQQPPDSLRLDKDKSSRLVAHPRTPSKHRRCAPSKPQNHCAVIWVGVRKAES